MSVLGRYKYAKNYKKLLIACYMFYLLSFAIKLVYTCQLQAIIDDFKTTRAQASLGLTIYYFVYAVAQIVLGMFIIKINVRNFLLVTSLMSAISFSMIGLTDNLTVVWVIFGLNGILQSGSVGGIMYIFAKYLPNETLSYANKVLATGSTIGNSLTYLISAIFVEFLSWKYTFVFFGVFLFASVVYMFIQMKTMDKIIKNNDEYSFEFDSSKDKKLSFVIPQDIKFDVTLLMTFIIVVSFFVNCLAYGIGNWIPSLLKDIHGFPTSLSILLTMFMPIISMLAGIAMYNSFDKSGKIITKTGILSLITLGLLLLMVFGYTWNFAFALIMCALLKYIPSCISAGYGSYTTMKLKYYINSGTSSLIVNSGAAIAAGLMPFITGYIMDTYGWQTYYMVMAGMCFVLVALIFVGRYIVQKRDNISKWF